jgi:hypothetical protein
MLIFPIENHSRETLKFGSRYFIHWLHKVRYTRVLDAS